MKVRLASALTLALLLAAPGTKSNAQTNPVAKNSSTVIKSDARLVVLDVMVTDGHGRAVSGLTLADFTLRENGGAQKLKSLEDHTGLAEALSVAEPTLPAGTYSNRPPVVSSIWNVLVFDSLNTGRDDQARTRAEVLKFSKTLPAGAPVALVVISASSAKVIVPFTRKGDAIEKALTGKEATPVPSPLLDVYNADGLALMEPLSISGAKSPGGEAFLAAANLNAQVVEMDRMDMRVNQTLRALSGIGGWLAQYPGKKNLYWLSSGFPLTAEPIFARDYDKPGATAVYKKNYLRLQQEMDKQLESARVAVFPIDVRGNSGAAREGLDTADVQGSRYAAIDGGAKLNDDMSRHDRRVNESQAGMLEMADATGGVATINRNGIAAILSDQFQQAERFYTLSYSPQNGDWNGEYRRISLELVKRGYKLYYRHGYYALDAQGSPAGGAGQPETTSVDAFSLAMRHGARPERAVLFTTRLERNPGGQISFLSNIDMRELSLVARVGDLSGNRAVASIDCAVVEYDESGKVLGTSQIHVEGKLKAAELSPSQTLPAELKVPLAAGARWATVGVRDHNSGRFGTLEVPLNPR